MTRPDVVWLVVMGIMWSLIKWALESITTNKASGGDGIPVELFQILKDDAMKVLHSLQDIKSTPRNPLHSYTLIMRKQKEN